jgi:two-component system, OmpR family, copper resistance phosphate regulon response regulator CusR
MKVLVIEDEVKLADLIKKGLENDGIEADVAYDGEDGYKKALNGKYNVIILDLMLPKMNGSEVCQSLKSKKVSTPILLLSAQVGVDRHYQEDFRCEADEYLAKPFGFEELITKLNKIASKNGSW